MMIAEHKTTSVIKISLGISIIFILSIFLTSCEFIAENDTSLQETSDQLSIEQTLNAFSAETLQAQQTGDSAQMTMDALQATNDAQATALSNPPTQSSSITDTPVQPEAPTPPPSPVPPQSTPIAITEWKMLYWRPLSSGCHLEDMMCWKLFDDFKTVGGPTDAALTSKEAVFIEESWQSPYLVFWHDYELKYDARIYLRVDGTLIAVKDYSKTKGYWKEDYVDLRDYKGKNVIVQFLSRVGERHINSWFIQDVKIVPDYTPK
jgi:hypothetical protein